MKRREQALPPSPSRKAQIRTGWTPKARRGSFSPFLSLLLKVHFHVGKVEGNLLGLFENQPKPWAPPTGIHDSWSRGIEPQPCLRVGRRQLVHHFLSTHLLPEASGGQLVMCRIAKKHQTRSRSPCAWPRRACTRKLWSWGVPKAARLPSPCPTPGRVRKHAGNRARERRQARKN